MPVRFGQRRETRRAGRRIGGRGRHPRRAAYVPDKAATFREFHRVLKPGGRISLAEPIMQDDAFEACAWAD